MRLRVANAPTSWGIEDPADPANPSWSKVLDDAAATGYAGMELGPLGFLPQDGATLKGELSARGLKLVAGYVMEPFQAPAEAELALGIAEQTCAVLAAAGGRELVIIQGFTPERDQGAGRPGDAPRATEREWERLVDTVHRVARVATANGLTPCFHPHAGTHVEFEDEIERFAADTDPDLVSLCIDTGHSAYAGVDPVALYRRHADRVKYFHLKDVDRARLDLAFERKLSFNEAVGERVFCPLGEGVVDFAGLKQALEEHGFDGWGAVEQDRLPTDSSTPAEDAAASLAHLRAVGLASDGVATQVNGGMTPQATVRLTSAQALVRFLSVQWSERDGQRQRLVPGIFGIFGHGNVCGLGPALEEEAGHDLRFYQPKNEQSMVHAAIGYARSKDLLSTLACTASIGPGATNLLTGAATATVNRVPVLLLASDTFATRLQGPVMQALEHSQEGDLTVNDAFRPLSAFFDRITRPEQLLTALPEAMRVLTEPAETGAVTLSLHQDVQAEAYDYPVSLFEPRTWTVSRRPPAAAEVRSAVDELRRAERPLVIAGGGVLYSEALPELAELSERFGIPVVETSAGKGALPNGELGLGGVGVTGTRAANELAREADLVVCVGTRLIDLTTGSHSLFQDPDVRFVGVNVRSRDAHKLGALPVVGDAKVALRELVDALGETSWSAPEPWTRRALDARARWDVELAEDLAPRDGELLSQGQALTALNGAMRKGDHLVVATGTPHVDVHKLWDVTEGTRCLMEVGFSCMGGELPAGLGVRMAQPDDGEVYVVIGDGTYLMGGTGELVTARQEGLKLTLVLIENEGYQSIHGLQRNRTGRSFGLEFRTRDDAADTLEGPYVGVDYAANARSLGCATYEAADVEQLEAALESARAETGPVVIVVRVEPRRLMLDSQCWWDVGIAEVSDRAETRAAQAEHAEGRSRQRFYYGSQ